MEIINHDDYEEIAATYQVLEIARLNEVLKKHGIADKTLRQEICSDFIFDSGQFLDSGWFEAKGRRVYPELYFAERSSDAEEGLGEIGKLYVTSEYFSFHEYALGDIYQYFEEQNETSGIENDVA